MKRLCSALAVVILSSSASVAWAGGYDTPMLYSARHIGMGGTAVGYVKDPSALFHNPAGLGHIKKLSLLADVSLLVGGIRSSPSPGTPNLDSNPVIAPFFIVGAGYRLTKWLTLGLAVYPVASASGAYDYKNASGTDVEDSTTLVFIESTLGAAVNIDAARLRIGAGYRITYLGFTRKQIVGDTANIELDMKGVNFLGLRVGAQWTAIPKHLQIGVSYRHKTVTKVKSDDGIALTQPLKNVEAEFTLPSRLIFGIRGDFANFGAAVDVEYAFNSQNKRTEISAELQGTRLSLPNIFNWDNAITLRVGGEYRIQLNKDNRLIPRLGFIYDARTAIKQYPSAFGTPPAPTYVVTAGLGWERKNYAVNVAYGYRIGTTTIKQDDLASPPADSCSFCSFAGDYKIFLNGIYVDFSYNFD